MKTFALSVALSAASIGLFSPASAQVNTSGYYVPVKLAEKAAEAALKACADRGYPVNAFVVDTSGLVIVQLRGDHATVHTKDSAFRKAYTVVTMGPIFGLDKTSESFNSSRNTPMEPVPNSRAPRTSLPFRGCRDQAGIRDRRGPGRRRIAGRRQGRGVRGRRRCGYFGRCEVGRLSDRPEGRAANGDVLAAHLLYPPKERNGWFRSAGPLQLAACGRVRSDCLLAQIPTKLTPCGPRSSAYKVTWKLARPTRFERVTFAFAGRCSWPSELAALR